MLVRGDNIRADEITVKKVSANPKFKILMNSTLSEVKGGQFAESAIIENIKTGEKIEMLTGGIFAEIGSIPNADFIKDLVKVTEFGQIVTDAKNQQTSVPGIWAAGDVTDGLYHQNNIASGDAVKALEDIYLYIHTK